MNTEELSTKLEKLLNEKKSIEESIPEYGKLLEQERDITKELERAVREDFVECWGKIYENKYDYLATLVGGSPEPLIRTILSIKPKKVLFIYTKEFEGSIDAIAEETGLKPSDWVKELIDISKPEMIYEIIKKYASMWRRMCVDISGGKKSMTTSAAIAAAFLGLDILYNDYTRYNAKIRRPEPGSEFLKVLDNPFETSQDLLERTGSELFNNSEFFNAKEMFRKANEKAMDPRRFEIFLQLSDAYHKWDSFEFASARNSFETALAKIEQYRIDHGFDKNTLQHHKEALDILAGVHKQGYIDVLHNPDATKALVYTCYASAQRMEKRGRLTDGVLRLYRCCEMMAQHRLALRGIETSNVDTRQIDERVIEGFRKIKSDALSQKHTEQIDPSGIAIGDRIGLFDDYVLLRAMDDELTTAVDLQRLFSVIEARNHSYVEHDIKIVNKKGYQGMKKVTDEILKRFCEINGLDQDGWQEYLFVTIPKR